MVTRTPVGGRGYPMGRVDPARGYVADSASRVRTMGARFRDADTVGMKRRLPLAAAVACGVLSLAPSAAFGSYLLDRNASNVTLRVDKAGTAQVSYTVDGHRDRVLLWGAINTSGAGQQAQEFRIDRSNGWKSGRNDPAKALSNGCSAYDGPDRLPFLVAPVCKAPDGTYWAVQSYQYTSTPSMNYGARIGDRSYAYQLRVSHWSGPIATIEARANWSYAGRYQHLFGLVQYKGKGVYGYKHALDGQCQDRFCRNIAIDSYDSDYGRGWRRANAILVNAPNGQWCFGLTKKGTSGGMLKTGASKVGKYRVYLSGPGVTPDPMLAIQGAGTSYDPSLQQQMADIQVQWSGGGANKCAEVN